MAAFIESEALLALLRGDRTEARRQVAKLLPGEAHELAKAAWELEGYASEQALADKGRESEARP